MEAAMTAFNIVRFRVKPGRVDDFIAVNTEMDRAFAGLRRIAMVKTGERDFCFVGEWDDRQSIAAAREGMTGNLDKMRDMLEDLGGGLGVTDPVSGEAVIDTSA
jgi:quinol monooxygenase YgiN